MASLREALSFMMTLFLIEGTSGLVPFRLLLFPKLPRQLDKKIASRCYAVAGGPLSPNVPHSVYLRSPCKMFD